MIGQISSLTTINGTKTESCSDNEFKGYRSVSSSPVQWSSSEQQRSPLMPYRSRSLSRQGSAEARWQPTTSHSPSPSTVTDSPSAITAWEWTSPPPTQTQSWLNSDGMHYRQPQIQLTKGGQGICFLRIKRQAIDAINASQSGQASS